MGKNHVEKLEATNEHTSRNSQCNSKQILAKPNECPEWLPDGWNVEVRIRKSGAHKGAEYKCYSNPLNGHKFYSKPEVLRYLETLNNNCTSKNGNRCTDMHSPSKASFEESAVEDVPSSLVKDFNIMESNGSVVEKSSVEEANIGNSGYGALVERSKVEDLPPGWIKEVKIRKTGNGIKKDPYYTDPVSGYIFRSKKDALRYLESGDVNACVYKPNKRQIQDEDNLTPSYVKKKSKQSATRRQLFAGKERDSESSSELPDANSSQKLQEVKVSAEIMVAPVSTGETVVKMHFLEDTPANPSEMKEKSDPDNVQEKNYTMNVMSDANERNLSNHSTSKNKKQSNMPHRFSRRLAGIEPNKEANTVTNEHDLQVPKRKLRESRTTIKDDLENKSSQCFDVVSEIHHAHNAPSMGTSMQGELLNESNKPSEEQGVLRVPPHRLETEKIDEIKPEYQYSHPWDSSSLSLNVPNNSLQLASETSVQRENKLHESDIGKGGNGKGCTNSNKSSKKKEHSIPRRASKRLAGSEPELKNNSIYFEKAPEYKSKKSRSEVNAAVQQSESAPATERADQASTNINNSINGESSNRSTKSPIVPAITDEQLEKLGDEEMDDEKSESQLSFAFHYSWSDPCVEFAIKTLTGVLPVEDTGNNGPPLVPETDALQKKNFEGGKENSSDKNPLANLKKSKNKKDLRVPRRLSKRLAGHEPELVPAERAPEYTSRKSNKDELTATVTLSNEASQYSQTVEEKELTLRASDSSSTRKCEVSSNKTEELNKAQMAPVEQLQKLEVERIGDEKLDPQLSLPLGDSWSDPCLEFAIRTLTGTLPEDAATGILPVVTPDINVPPNAELFESVVDKSICEEDRDISNESKNKNDLITDCQTFELLLGQTSELLLPNKELLESVMEKSINEEVQDISNDSKSKNELNLDCQTSEQLLGQPELRTISTSCVKAPLANSEQANVTKNLKGESSLVETGTVRQLANQSINLNALIHEEPPKNSEQFLEGTAVLAGQPEMNHENPDLQFCAPFMGSWLDPCLEFAFKTLTGAIPVDDNLAIEGGFQEPANSHSQGNNGSALPDFGSPSFSQSAISFHNDIEEKSIPQQQQSSSSSFLPLENKSLHGWAGVDSRNPYSQCNKNF